MEDSVVSTLRSIKFATLISLVDDMWNIKAVTWLYHVMPKELLNCL